MNLKRKIIPYIYIFLFSVFSDGIFAQKIELKITSKNSTEAEFLREVNFIKKHSSEENVLKQVDSISEKLKKAGYFYNTFDSIQKKDSIRLAYFSLGKKINKAIISVSDDFPVRNFEVKDNKVEVPIEQLSFFLSSISTELDNKGKSFSEVRLKNISLKDDLLFASLFVDESKKRTIDRVIVKGYENFSKSHIKHFLNIKKGTVFNQLKLSKISDAIQSLGFVSEIKPPEVLFSKDSTLVYIYLKKEKVNNFDGLVNFASKENSSGLLFNGHLDLKLNNILHTGEQFELFWKANGEERQEFTISTQIPYIFNSAFSPDLSFKIYRQDSTFLNTKFHGGLNYIINPRISIGGTYDSETSKNTLQNNINNNIEDFDNYFFGAQFLYRLPNNDIFLNDRFYLKINPTFGSRSSLGIKNSQFKIDTEVSYIWSFNLRNSIFIRNQTGYINSDNFIENELYRIGGAGSIRGFNEQSIFTSQFSYFNIEYRYLTSINSYLYSITDLGRIKTTSSNNESLFGIGLGYLFRINNSQINLGYALGKLSNQDFNFNQSKLILKIISYF